MKFARCFRKAAVGIACLGMIAPRMASAATPVDVQPMVADVALQAGGTLHGQVVDGQGQTRVGSKISVLQQQVEVATTKTDSEGNFAISGLRGGVHQVVTTEGVATYRFWAPNTAPPAAPARALVIADKNIVRGGDPCYGPCPTGAGGGGGAFVRFITNPWVLAGGVAAAIAIPIALNNDDDSGS